MSKISETTKVRMMVLPIIAMLAVTMMIAGYRDEGEMIDVDDEDGFDEFLVEPLSSVDEPHTRPQNGSLATVYIDRDSYIQFDVFAREVHTGSSYHLIEFYVQIEGEFEDDLDPESLLINTEEISELSDTVSKVDFEFSSLREENLTYSHTRSPWSLGHDIDANEFEISVVLQWKIYHGYQYENLTLELSAIVEGFSEEVSAVIHAHVKGDEL